MHTYSTDNERRPRVYWGLAIASYFAAGGAGAFAGILSRSLPVALGVSVSTGLMFSLFLGAYNRWLWNTAPARAVGATKVPDLNGDWKGRLKTDYEGDIGDEALHEGNDPDADRQTMWAKMHIDQNWRKINVYLETETSASNSNGATILTDDGRWPSINYPYSNVGSRNPGDDVGPHDGTADLAVKEDEDGRLVLEGFYYTGPDRETTGEMRLVRVGEPEN